MTTRPTIADYLKTMLDVDSLPEGFHRDQDVLEALVDAKVRIRHVASVADVSRAAVYKQLKKYDIDPPHGISNNDPPTNSRMVRLLERTNPDDIGGPTPTGDESWRDYYRDSEESEV